MAGRRIDLVGACNFRDLGGFVSRDGATVGDGLVYRSDALHRLTAADMAKLGSLGIATVFDLRSDVELGKDGVGPFAEARRHVRVPLVAVSLSPFDADIDWRQIDLQERYVEMLEVGGGAIRAVFEGLAAAAAAPAVFHCTGGKDRTGVVAALLLRTLGVDDEDIITDYARSQGFLAERLRGYRIRLLQAGLDHQAIAYLTSSPPARMRYMLGELDRRWGCVDIYLAEIGVGRDVLAGLRRNLLDR